MSPAQESFATRLISWQRQHGRHGLPWQGAEAYFVWLSEIMLQQTQVATVIPYYLKFIAAFPDVQTLAAASEEQVLTHWSGLGYYARARNLHRAAQIIAMQHHGNFPRDFEHIIALPGIGRSTAAAICALAYGERRAILDGNVKRVLARYCGIDGWPGSAPVMAQLWAQAEALLPHEIVNEIPPAIAVYTQALMDMGAMICTRSRPKCALCPVQENCVALLTDRIAELPAPRPRSSIPEKHSRFLVVMHGNQILLEKRAASGIWGGLWCLPQIENDDKQLAEFFRANSLERPGLHSETLLPPFTHTFTHFKLHITPLLIRIDKKPLRTQQGDSAWMQITDALHAAIPTPVRKILGMVEPMTKAQ